MKNMYFLPRDSYLRPISMKFCMTVELSWQWVSPLLVESPCLHIRGSKMFFGQYVFGIMSSVSVINKIHSHASVDLVLVSSARRSTAHVL